MAELAQPSIEQKVAFLRRVPLFYGIEDKLLAVLAGVMRLERIAAGTRLCQEGGPGDACFIVGHGSVEILAKDGAGERVLSALGVGHTVGEVALVDGKKRSASVRCAVDSSIFFLRREDFEQLFSSGNPASMRLLDNIARSLAARVRAVNQKFADVFSRAGDTMQELSARLKVVQAQALGEGDGDGEADDDLLSLVGYSGKGVPSSK
jgi:CRP/FNR family transcriptional regulator, cyclic AMP receptor protein